MRQILFSLLLLPSLIFCQKFQQDYKNQYKKISKDDTPPSERIHDDIKEKTRSIMGAALTSFSSLSDGDSPYDSYFGRGVYDKKSYNEVTFENSNSSDVVVCLENVYSGTTIRNEYIRRGSSFKMTQIPNGTYIVKVFYGNNWDSNRILAGGKIRGGFTKNVSFTTSDHPSDYLLMNQKRTPQGITYSQWSVTLYTVSNGNMEQTPISDDAFFK